MTLTLLSLGIFSQKLKRRLIYLGNRESREEEASHPPSRIGSNWRRLHPCADVQKAPSDTPPKAECLPGRSKKIRLLQVEKWRAQKMETQALGGPVSAETCCMPQHEDGRGDRRRLGQDLEEFRHQWALSSAF